MLSRLWQKTVTLTTTAWHVATGYQEREEAALVENVDAMANVFSKKSENYIKLKNTAKNLQSIIEPALEKRLDTEVYQQFFTERNSDNLFSLPAERPEQDAILYDYKNTINLLIQFQLLMDKLIALHNVIDPLNLHSFVGKAELAWQMPALFAQGVEAIQTYQKIDDIIASLGIASTLETFTSMPLIKEKLVSFISPVRRMLAPKHIDILPSALVSIFSKAQPPSQNDLDKVMSHYLDKLPKDGHDRVKIDEATKRIANIKKHFAHFATAPQTLTNTLLLVVDIYGDVMWLIENLTRIFDSVGVVFQEYLLLIAQYINQVLKNIFIQLDEYEIKSLLEKSEYTLLSTLIEQFNALIEKLGYEFDSHDRYPYVDALQDKREALRLSPQTGPATTLVLNRHIEKTNRFVKTQAFRVAIENAAAKKAASRNLRQEALKLIDDRIAIIQSRLQSYWITPYAAPRKIQLLTALRAKILEHTSLHGALDAVAAEGDNKQDMHLLWEGRTGEVLHEIRKKTYTKQDYLEQITDEITRLKAQRKETLYFFAGRRKTDLEDSIRALELLKTNIKKQGFRLKDVLNELHANQKTIYNILHKNEKPLLNALNKIDENITALNLGKKVIGAKEVQPLPSTEIIAKQKAALQAKIESLKDDQAWLYTSCKQKKINLLEKLTEAISTQPLAVALYNLGTHPDTHADFYLLREGRTGALIDQLEYELNPREELLTNTQVAITRLYSQREKTYGLFTPRPAHVDARIITLKQLKQALTECEKVDNTTLAKAVTGLEKQAPMIEADLKGFLCPG